MENKNKAAFPAIEGSTAFYEPGLSKREIFAMAALQGLMANIGQLHGSPQEYGIGKLAVACADEVLSELSKPQP